MKTGNGAGTESVSVQSGTHASLRGTDKMLLHPCPVISCRPMSNLLEPCVIQPPARRTSPLHKQTETHTTSSVPAQIQHLIIYMRVNPYKYDLWQLSTWLDMCVCVLIESVAPGTDGQLAA